MRLLRVATNESATGRRGPSLLGGGRAGTQVRSIAE